MNIKKLICCAFFVFFVFVIIGGCVAHFRPVAVINGTVINEYQYIQEANKQKELIISEMTDRIILNQFTENLGITVSEEDLQRETDALLNERDIKDKSAAEEMALQGLMIQKSIEYFAETIQPDADDIKAYYEQNKARYGEEPDYESIKTDFKMEKGEKMYESEFSEFKKKADIKIYR